LRKGVDFALLRSSSLPLTSFRCSNSTAMSGFEALIKFTAKEDQEAYFAPATYRRDAKSGAQLVGTTVTGYASIHDLRSKVGGKDRTVDKVRSTRLPSSSGTLLADMWVAAPCAATVHNSTHILRRSQLQVACRGSQGTRHPYANQQARTTN
jgi:hypothetical protein